MGPLSTGDDMEMLSLVKFAKKRYGLNRRGFTLIELMVVVVILVILTAFAIPIYSSTIQVSEDRVNEANVRVLNGVTYQWMLKSEENDPLEESTETLKEKLSSYLLEWPQSPNGKSYKLENGQWKVE